MFKDLKITINHRQEDSNNFLDFCDLEGWLGGSVLSSFCILDYAVSEEWVSSLGFEWNST